MNIILLSRKRNGLRMRDVTGLSRFGVQIKLPLQFLTVEVPRPDSPPGTLHILAADVLNTLLSVFFHVRYPIYSLCSLRHLITCCCFYPWLEFDRRIDTSRNPLRWSERKCKMKATRELIDGEWYLRCVYLIGMGFGASGLSLFALRPGDTWSLTEVSY